jgi:hypothetical protein
VSNLDLESRLAYFCPLLCYDSRESYYADSPQAITDVGATGGPYCNVLRSGSGELIAASNPALFAGGPPKLGLSFLRATYPTGSAAQETDVLREEGPLPAIDARAMHAEAEIANHVCGRIVESPDAVWLQYWLFHYYNDILLDDHQGDWEMVQIELSPEGEPRSATLSQHGHGDTRRFDELEQRPDDKDPAWTRYVVYPALGSHALYIDSGSHHAAILDAFDRHDGRGPTIGPDLIRFDDQPGSLGSWPGVWGGSKGIIAKSPVAPKRQGSRWDDPARFAAEGKRRIQIEVAAQDGNPAVPSPPRPPDVSVQREGSNLVLRYEIADPTTSTPTAALMITLEPTRAATPPLTVTAKTPLRTGTITLPYDGRARVAGLDVVALDRRNQESDPQRFDAPA